MVSFTYAVAAFAGAASAINFGDWCQHNGLITHYNQFIKDDQTFVNTIETQSSVTVFIPTDAAWERWQSNANYSSETFAATTNTFLYMTVPGEEYMIKDLTSMNGKNITTMLSGQSVKVEVQGVLPNLTPVLLTGTGGVWPSTAGVINQDFRIGNGYVQLVDAVFQLPNNTFKTANQNTAKQPSAGIKNYAPAAAGIVVAAAAALLL